MTFWVAGAVVGGALISSDASRSASNKQRDAAAASDATQRYFYDTNRADQAPYRQAGYGALDQINALLGLGGSPHASGLFGGLFGIGNQPASALQALQNQPGYQFGLNQGQTALDRSAASRGGLYSGATLKALERFGQDYAGSKLGETYNRLASVAGLGQTAVAGTNQAGMNAGNQISASQQGLGNALGANALNQGNVWGNAVNQIGAYAQRPSSPGSSISNGALWNANMSDDPIGTLGSSQGWWTSSDIRLKTNIRRIGTTSRGYNAYSWDWKDGSGSSSGVMAHEVQAIDPSAVTTDANGFLMVNYRKV
jgi:hypothetical protein